MALETTDRGFKIYGRLVDTKGSHVRVQESSAVGRPSVWVFANTGDPDYDHRSPHLNAEQAYMLIQALQAFIADSQSADNWRNDEDYQEKWWG